MILFLQCGNIEKMKRICLLLCLPFAALFFSCSTDVNLYAEYKQVPIIYGLLEPHADTSFVKITRSFYVQGDPHETALNPDSSNYPGKLDARIIEYCNGDSVREIILDTITVIDKEQGLFYAPMQKLYYTTEQLPLNSTTKKYSYKLKVVLPEFTLYTTTDLVGDSYFDVQSLGVDFSKIYINSVSRRFLFRPAINASYYDVSFAFNFKEQRTPDGDSVPRTVQWFVGTYSDYELSTRMEGDFYVFYYRPEVFYQQLEEFIGNDTDGVSRFFGDYPVDVIITAGGDKLDQYVHVGNALVGTVQSESDLSLIDGGYGVFSSRYTIRHAVGLAGETVPDLLEIPQWGFKFIGGKKE
jgi:hypothetical protein